MPARKYLVRTLERTADLLDILGSDEFRARAYRGAARSLEALTETETPELLEREFGGIPRVGKGIAAELSAYARSGTFAPLAEAEAQLPPTLLELLEVRGLGPKKIRALWQSGLDSLEKLREAGENGSLARLKGFGAKSAASIVENVTFIFEARRWQHLSTGSDIAALLVAALEGKRPGVLGEVGRGLEVVQTVRLSAEGNMEDLRSRLAGTVDDLTDEENVLRGTVGGVPAEVVVVTPTTRGAASLWASGGDTFRAALDAAAEARGLRLGSAGLWRGDELLPTPTEADAFAALGLPERPAEYREPEHDALWPDLPAPAELLSVPGLRGMLHTHSTWSDGQASIAEMVGEALRLGHEFLGTADHSRAAHYAHGLSVERLREQLREVRELQRAGLPLVAGAEVDILEDGSLDYPDDVLAELDYVVASVHSGFGQERERQTERLIRAVQHPLVTILGHPTGRLLLRRPGYEVDVEAVLSACEAASTVVELNANPLRLDLDWRVILRWRERLYWAVNTDAHTPRGLGDARYGVAVARKAALTPQRVINCLSRGDFLSFVAQQRRERGIV